MSEGNGYATIDSLVQASKKPRTYADVDIPGFGKIQVHTVNAGEWCAVDAAKNRAILALTSGTLQKQIAALKDYFVEVAKAGVANPAFTDAHREYLLGLDSSIADAIRSAVLTHCSISEVSVEGAEKNFETTSGDSSPIASGSI